MIIEENMDERRSMYRGDLNDGHLDQGFHKADMFVIPIPPMTTHIRFKSSSGDQLIPVTPDKDKGGNILVFYPQVWELLNSDRQKYAWFHEGKIPTVTE